MKCQNCGQNEANFFQRSNINGQINETHLCAECAERLGAMQNLVTPMPSLFNEFFSGFGRASSPFGGFVPVLGFIPRYAAPRLGGLAPERAAAPVQPAAQAEAQPEAQPEVDEGMKKQREINMLREQMKKAAETEDFEKAISLREEIRQLEA